MVLNRIFSGGNTVYGMCSRTFETLDNIIREAREELSTYRDILEISDRIKIVEPRKDFSNDRKDVPQVDSNFKKRGEITFSAGASPGGFKKSESPTPRVEDLKDVECFKCHKKRHYTNMLCPESRGKIRKELSKCRKSMILDQK